ERASISGPNMSLKLRGVSHTDALPSKTTQLFHMRKMLAKYLKEHRRKPKSGSPSPTQETFGRPSRQRHRSVAQKISKRYRRPVHGPLRRVHPQSPGTDVPSGTWPRD